MKRIFVVGGTGGIGQAIACAFAQDGAHVVATGATVAEVESAASVDNVAWIPLDVTDDDQVRRTVESFDRLDVLVNCAGIILRDAAEHTVPGFERVIDVNLTGTMRVCVACRPLLAASNGCVVNTASMLSYFGSRYAPGYSASKGGIVQLTKSLAIDWASDGIRVNAVAPGWIRTPLTRPLYEDSDRHREIVERTPLGRWGASEEVADVVLFLASPAARFVTGATIPVDGGYHVA